MQLYQQMLRTQWAWTRMAALGLGVVTFALPSLIWRLAGLGGGGPAAPLALIQGFQMGGPALALLSLAGGAVMAATPWVVDAEAKHVYPLSLPIAWPRFVAIRYAIGALLLMIPAVALYVGAQFILLRMEMPDVLRAYPGALSLRYYVALLMAYSVTFAVQYIFGKRAALVTLVGLLSFAGLSVLLSIVGEAGRFSWLGAALFEWPGPFSIYTESWKLIDV